jgi:hypothetical protein
MNFGDPAFTILIRVAAPRAGRSTLRLVVVVRHDLQLAALLLAMDQTVLTMRTPSPFIESVQ